MGKPIVNSTARRPGVVDRDTEEALRVLENRLANLENAVANETQVDDFDDSVILNNIKNLYRQIDILRKKPGSSSSGDTYDSYFDVTISATADSVDISAGRILFPGTTAVAGSTLGINVATNGTHYIYCRIYYSSGSWQYTFVEATSVPSASDLDIPYMIAELEVVANKINSSSIIQHQFGELINPPAAIIPNPVVGDDYYAGPFKVYQTVAQEGTRNVTVDAGRFVYGTGSTAITGSVITVGSTAQTYHIYFVASYSAGLVTDILDSVAYPTQTDTLERVLLAEVDVASFIVSEVRQIHYGEIHSTRIWE